MLAAGAARSQAELSLKKMREKGTATPDAPLPIGLRLRMYERIKLRTYAEKPDMFKEQLDAIKSLEKETEKKLYDLIIAARQKEVTHLTDASNFKKLIAAAQLSFNTNVLTPFVANFSDKMGEKVESTSFPIQAALTHFNEFITDKASAAMVTHASEAQQQHKQRALQQQAESIAEEDVMSQPSINIEQIATAAAFKATQPLMADVKQQLNKLQQFMQSTTSKEKSKRENQASRQKSAAGENQKRRLESSSSSSASTPVSTSTSKLNAGHKRHRHPASSPSTSSTHSPHEPVNSVSKQPLTVTTKSQKTQADSSPRGNGGTATTHLKEQNNHSKK